MITKKLIERNVQGPQSSNDNNTKNEKGITLDEANKTNGDNNCCNISL